MSNVRTRFAPSPTGSPESIHLGFVIRALWSYAFAVKNGGQYILRIEDTDQKRSRNDTEQEIYKIFHDFGINHHEGPDVGGDFGPYRQSERLEIYAEYAHKLVELGAAYYDFDAKIRDKEEIKAQYTDAAAISELKKKPEARYADPAESKKRMEAGEPYVVRAKMPEDKVYEYEDWILRKKVKIHSKEVSDLILFKSDGFPTYHLAVVVDDSLMKISHVFRGVEWISTTPIHLFLYDSLGLKRPEIGHFPVVIDPNTGKKFSKRDLTGVFGVHNWLSRGYLKEALLNYLMLLGWAPKDNSEIFSLSQFVDAFSQEGIQKANPSFNLKKLDWFQGQYMRNLSVEELYDLTAKWFEKFKEFESEEIAKLTGLEYLFEDSVKGKVIDCITLLQERTLTLRDIVIELNVFFTAPTQYQDFTEIKGLGDKSKEALLTALEELKSVINIDDQEVWVAKIREIAAKYEWKDGDMFMLLRLSLWGKQFSPPLFEAMQLIDNAEIESRLNNYTAQLKK